MGSLSLLVALSGFLALASYLFRSRHEAWGGWAASMPLADDTPISTPATEEAA
ncbi:MAG: hypothetical protein R3F62_22240 [Planctomycetota bacterium]